jgi:hypothetical protein
VPGVCGRGHGLLAHLTLVHVPGALVEVGQWDGPGQVTHERSLVQLHMGGLHFEILGVTIANGNVQVYLKKMCLKLKLIAREKD